MKYFIVLSIALLLAVSLGEAQSPRIAYVNSETILRELPEAQQVKKELETTIKAWQDQLAAMSKELQDGLDDYQKKQALLDPKAKADKEKSLQDMQQKAREFQYQKFDSREGEAVQLQQKKFAPIQERVMKVIEQVAKEDRFNYVFDKLDNAAIILYADSQFDLTYKVLDRLKRGSAPATSTKSKETK